MIGTLRSFICMNTDLAYVFLMDESWPKPAIIITSSLDFLCWETCLAQPLEWVWVWLS